MQPIEIVNSIGREKVEAIVDDFNSGQFKRVLNSADISTRIPTRILSLKKRAEIWKGRLMEAVQGNNFHVAQSLIYEWLIHRKRPMLASFLDKINVKHRNGETDESFLKTVPEPVLREKAKELESDFNAQDVAIYVHFLDFHQQADVFAKDDHFMDTLKKG
ncbi:hypothetical protein KKF84_20845 [Myxococcota bacterium]|nr:hypothetical protein [Myxococcota bacterium]MBU1537773.1 hypothetical protein [Myxococcota bacterium]